MNIEHILVPTDLLQPTFHAYRHAAALARAYGAHVTALHIDEVAAWQTDLPDASDHDLRTWLEVLRSDHFRIMDERFHTWKVPMEFVVRTGIARTRIPTYARNNDVDLIVMPRRARRVPDVLAGSTTLRVLRLAESPVLVVPVRGVPDPVMPRYQRLMVATDFGAPSIEAARWSVDLADRLDTELSITHVAQMPHVFGGTENSAPITWSRDDAGDPIEERLTALAESLHKHGVTTHVSFGADVGTELARAAVDLDADMIVTTATGRGRIASVLLGSTTARLIRRAGVPVLVLPRRLETETPGPEP